MKTPPLIAHIVYKLDTGGLENGLVNIINRMPAHQFRHMVICLTDKGRFSERIHDHTVPIIELHKPPGNSLTTLIQLRKVLLQHKPDIVHSRNLAALEAQWVTLLMPGVKRVHSEHGRDVGDLHGTYWKYNLLRKVTRPLIAHYVAVSQDLKQWLIDTIGASENKVSQIYNGVDLKAFNGVNSGAGDPAIIREVSEQLDLGAEDNQGKKNAIIIGTVGRLTAVKDQKTLLQAVASARVLDADLGNRLRLIIVGDGVLKEELMQLSKSLHIDDITWFPGDRNDVANLLQALDIFVLPSLMEGISNTLLEAMASNLPVIATHVGGTPEIINNNVQGILISPQDVDALRESILDLARHSDKRLMLGTQGRKTVEKYFTWDNTIDAYSQVYSTVLSQGREKFAHGSL